MANYYAPGVYIEEKSSGNKPIAGVSTSVAVFIGVARKGDINKPTLVTNFSEFQKKFGGPYRIITGVQEHYLYYSVKHFFEQGGGKCYIVRVAHYKDINNKETLEAISSKVAFNGITGEAGKGLYTTDTSTVAWSKNNGLAENNINSMLVESSGATTYIYIATDNGVFKGTEAADDWVSVNIGLTTKDVRSLFYDSGTSTLYAGTTNGVYKKLDSNAYWEKVGSKLFGNTVNAFALVSPDLFVGTNAGIYRAPADLSTDWEYDGLSSSYITSLVLMGTNLHAGSDSGVYSRATTSPFEWSPVTQPGNTNIHKLFMKGSSDLIACTEEGIYSNTDTSTSWDMVANADTMSAYDVVANTGNDTLYAATSNGVYKKADSDTSWTHLATNNLDSKNVHSIVLANTDAMVLAGTSETRVVNALTISGLNPGKWANDLNAKILNSSKFFVPLAEDIPAGTGKTQITLADNSDVQIGTKLWLVDEVTGIVGSVTDNNISSRSVYSILGDSGSHSFFIGTDKGVYLRDDGESDWKLDKLDFDVRATVHDSTNIYIGTEKGVYTKSLSGPSQWTEYRNNTLTNKNVQSLVMNGDELLVGTNDGIFKTDTSDPSDVWNPDTSTSGIKILSLLKNSNDLYAGTDKGVYESINGGSWAIKEGGESINNVNAVTFDTSLFAGTDTGVYKFDAGNSEWKLYITDPVDKDDPINKKSKNLKTNALFYKTNKLYAGTEGGLFSRGVADIKWTKINIIDNSNNRNELKIISFAEFEGVLYVGTDRGLYYTLDSATSWHASNSGSKEITINGPLYRAGNTYTGDIKTGISVFGSDLEYLGKTKLLDAVIVSSGIPAQPIQLTHLDKVDGSLLTSGDPITFAITENYVITNNISSPTSPGAEGIIVHFTPCSLPTYSANSTKAYASDFMLLVAQDKEVAEVHENLSLVDLNKSDHVDLRLGPGSENSIYISIKDSGNVSDAVRLLSTDFLSFSGGNDGLAGISDADFLGSELTKTGLHALDTVKDASIICVPNASENVTGGVIGYCDKRKDLIYVADHPSTSSDDIRDYTAKFSTTYAAIYYPWVKITDVTTGRKVSVPPCGAVAGIYAKTDVKRGVHKAPAGFDTGKVTIATGLDEIISKAEYDLLYQEKINAIRKLPSGFHVWGTRTLSADSEWKYVNVRRLFIFLEQSIERGTQWVTFEPNDASLWKSIERNIKAFLKIQWLEGKLVGATEDEAFFVRCNEETNPQEVVDAGQVITLIGVAPSKPAEFVIFRIKQKAASS